MVRQAGTLSNAKALANVQWRLGSAYALPYPAKTFDIVTCRFAFHHLENPKMAFSEMIRVASSGARILLCNAVAFDNKAQADAFNEMERFRDPSTVEFRTLEYLRDLFVEAGLGSPAEEHFQVPYLAHELVARSFPERDDRAGLLRLIEDSIAGDLLGMNARNTEHGIQIAFQSVVLSAVKPDV